MPTQKVLLTHCHLLHLLCLPVIYRATPATNLISAMTSPFYCDIFVTPQSKNEICERPDIGLAINILLLQFFEMLRSVYCLQISPRFRRVGMDLDRERALLKKSGNFVFSNFVLFCVLFVLCRSVYCLCVNVYCTTATGWQSTCSQQIYHIISYHIISYHNMRSGDWGGGGGCYVLKKLYQITQIFSANILPS